MSLVILLLYPVLERLQPQGPRARRFARRITEAYVADVDDCLREMGVGDMAVPKKVKKAAQALAERCRAYAEAAADESPAPALAARIAATVPGVDARPESAKALALFVHDLRAMLAGASDDNLLAGQVSFPILPLPPGAKRAPQQHVMETPR